jgi:hypothetical protein
MNSEPALLYTPSRAFRRVTLEMSLKPFYDTSAAMRIRVAEQLYRQWMPICHRAETVCVMLWIGDGSEILDYRGDLDSEFEWGRWLGSANHWQLTTSPAHGGNQGDEQGLGFHARSLDPDNRGLHVRSYPYHPDAPQFTYRWLGELMADLKRIGQHLTGKPIEIGLTFDPGPEFSISDFKYRRHPELCQAGLLFGKSFVPCTAKLHADDVAYAGFPQGIPEGTGIGMFLGRQVAQLQAALAFDFIWFSNGFGFGGETWSLRGALFDGDRFCGNAAASQRESILEFWRAFRHECPQLPIRTRGTNLTTGVDLASDGVPLRDIYREMNNVEAPVNSPWAALDGDFGLELTGWMSHIAELPGEDFSFRFYAHDPWWMNSPWLDRFERRAHDIFLPLGVSRIDADGTVQPADNLSLLTVDNSHGQMPDTVAAEISAHLLRTRELAPDALGPLLWVYPFEEYHNAVFSNPSGIATAYFGDWFVRGMINNGLPLNTVASTENFLRQFATNSQRFSETVVVAPVPMPNTPLHEALLQHAECGGKVLLYGPIDETDTELLKLFGLQNAQGWEGDLPLHLSHRARALFSEETVAKQLHHPSIFSAGPLRHAFCGVESDELIPLALAEQESDNRALTVVAKPAAWNGGAFVWLRGGVGCDEQKTTGLLPAPLDSSQYFIAESLARAALDQLGISIAFSRGPESRVPMLTIARSDNAWAFAIYNPDAAAIEFRLPHGAPVPLGQSVNVTGSISRFVPPVTLLGECRVFVEQQESSTLYVQEVPSIMAGVRRRWLVNGLCNATLRFFPESYAEQKIEFLCEPVFPYFTGDFREARCVTSPSGIYYELHHLTGNLLISR